MLKHAIYAGPLAHLKGATALIQETADGRVLAQFDDKYLTRDGKPWEKVLEYEPHARFPSFVDPDQPPAEALGYGWHRFHADDFDASEAQEG